MPPTFNTELSPLFLRSKRIAATKRPSECGDALSDPECILDPAGRTDLANAQRVSDSDDFRYCPNWDMFWIWDYWRWIPDNGRNIDYLAQLEAERLSKGDGVVDCPEAMAFAEYSCSSVGIANAVSLVRSNFFRQVAPEEFDQDPLLWNTCDGAIFLGDGSLRPHERWDYCTGLCNLNYDPDARCPAWKGFLRDALGNDRDLVRYVQRALGYTLTADVGEEVVFVCHGPDSFYKSAFLEIVAELLGPDYGLWVRPDELEALRIRPDGVGVPLLFGRRGVVAAGPSTSQVPLSPQALLQLVNRDPVQLGADLLRRWEFRPTYKLWLSARVAPGLEGTEYDLRRRVSCIPFAAARPEPYERRRLLCDLSGELPGILNWCRAGIDSWFHHDGVGTSSAETSSKQSGRASRARAPSHRPTKRLIKKRKGGRKPGKS